MARITAPLAEPLEVWLKTNHPDIFDEWKEEEPPTEALHFPAFVTMGERDSKGWNWKYWNVPNDNGQSVGVYIVAVVHGIDGEAFDWAAYIGGSEAGSERERDGYEHIARFGAKLSAGMARKLFPDYALIPYRS